MKVAVAAARMVGAERNAGVAVEPAGDVEREYRSARRVGAFDERRIGVGERAGEADPEQAIDDQRPVPQGREIRHRSAAGLDEEAMRVGRVRGKARRVGAKDDFHVEERLAQPARHDESVAAVVAGSREHEDRSAAIPQDPCDAGRGRSRALHQRLPAGRRLDAAHVRRAVDGKESHRTIIGRGGRIGARSRAAPGGAGRVVRV